MKSTKILIVATLLTLSCSDALQKKENYPKNLFTVIKEGELIEKSYTFCAILPKEIKYSYRKGIWTFKTEKGKLIARGKYDTQLISVDNHGGCPYSFIKNTVNMKDWEFWNDTGERIEPTKRLIKMIGAETRHYNKTANQANNHHLK